jgi:poly-gamma-glutamate synthesis protein (capsule biosynthesis protein)
MNCGRCSIVITGDVCPMGEVEDAFVSGLAAAIFGDLLEEIRGADLAIVNLECPLVSKRTPIEKAGGAVLAAAVGCARGLAASGFKVANIANNHIGDHGARGIKETISGLSAAGILAVGAGANIDRARQPLILDLGGTTVVVFSMAEREFSAASQSSAGPNPIDMIEFVRTRRAVKYDCRFIVLVHGGKELFGYPSPETVRRCRFMVEQGADAVVCCHAHSPGPWEYYEGRPIVYGLGNLVFETTKERPASWYVGYLARLELDGENVGVKVIPHCQSAGKLGARKLVGAELQHFMVELQSRGSVLNDLASLEREWLKQCRRERDVYLSELFGYGRVMQRFKGGLLKLLHSKKEILNSLLLVECETHREVLSTLFRDERADSFASDDCG